MLEKIKISHVGYTLASLVLVLTLLFYLLTNNLNKEIGAVNTTWETYQASRSEKARLESNLSSTLGYGGMIHAFKNLILRQDVTSFNIIRSDFGAAHIVFDQYRALGVNGAEEIALDDIENVIHLYRDASVKISELLEAGTFSPEELDAIVRIDDGPALRGLEILTSEIFNQSSMTEITELSNGQLVALLRSQFGYGGLIHHFKNYVLRHEQDLITSFNQSFAEAEATIIEYQSRDITNTEKIALEDISATLIEYQKAFMKAQEITGSASEIDQAVKVNDVIALRSFTLLDREVVALTERNAASVRQELSIMQEFITFSRYSGILFAIVFIIVAFISINTFVLNPIKSMTHVMRELAGGETDIEIPYLNQSNEVGNMAKAMVTFQNNLIGLKSAEAKVRKLALTDTLTNLANRGHFEQRFEEVLNLTTRLNISGALMTIDLDGFKLVNDTYGHPAGDHLLKVIAERLSNASREVDVVARLGGDEFSIIAVGLEKRNHVTPLAERIISEINRPIIYNDNKLSVSASIGVSFFPAQGNAKEELVIKADNALYEAKEKGKNQFVLYEDIATPSMYEVNSV